MIKQLRAVPAAVFALALFGMPAGAEEPSPVREMMVVSGMVGQFAGLGESARAGVLQSGEQAQMPRALVQGLADIVARRVDGQEFLDSLEVGLEETLSADETAAVTAFYRTPLGERVREVEVAAASVDAQMEIDARRSELRAELEKDPERLAFARSIDEGVFASELSATVVTNIARAMLIGTAQAEGGVDPGALAAVDRRMTAMHGAVVEQMRELLLATFAWTYRDVSNADLEAYAAFLETPASRAVYATMFEVTDNYLTGQSRKIGADFGALIRQKRT